MTAAIALDEELARFIAGPVSIHAASCDAAGVANVARALGCRLAADGRRVTVLLPAAHSSAMAEAFRANGRIAVVFSRPSTHRTVQLKGSDAGVQPAEAGDGALMQRYADAFVQELMAIGYAPGIPRTLLATPGEVIPIGFTVCEAFTQTPGPAAGAPIAA